jgi:Sulfate permease and related transporters (MFS superfamily)
VRRPVASWGTLGAIPEMVSSLNVKELILGLLTFGILLALPMKYRKFMPPQLLTLIVGTVIALLFFAGDIRVIGTIPDGLPSLHMPAFAWEQWQIMLVDALVLAMLGSIDALLTSVIAENLTKQEADPNKELVGQGVGNMASGLC